MKQAFRLFLALVLLTGAGACSDKDRSTPAIRINDGDGFLSLDALSRSGTLTVQAAAPWEIINLPDANWFSLSRTDGPMGKSEIDITFDANDGEARSVRLTIACGDILHYFTLSQAAAHTSFEATQYNFYIAFGTLPALYSGLHLLGHDKPSYLFYERTKTFDAKLFPPRVTVITSSDPNSNASGGDIDRMRTRMKQEILEINKKDPTAVFGLYTNEITCRIGYDWFVAQGIDSARVKVSMLSDGTATYNNFFAYFGNAATAQQNWDAYAAEVEALDWDHGGRYPVTRAPAEYNSPTWPYYLSTRPDYRLIVQNETLLETTGAFMAGQLEKMQVESVQPYELLTALPETTRQEFYRIAMFDYDNFAAQFDKSPKKNLVIIGTSHTTSESAAQQAAYVGRIAEQYGDQYDIFFKPHPADTSSANYPDRFPGLTLLPGQMPFEIFVWSLLDKIDLIGGYPSTVFISVPLDKVGFLFAANAQSLVHPLNLLFRDDTDIEWIQ